MRKLLREKRSLEDLEKRSEEVKKQTRTQKKLNSVEKRAMAENRRDNNVAMAENAQKIHERRREDSEKKEQTDKKSEKLRVEKIKAETKSFMELEKAKEELAKQKNLLEIKQMQIDTERKREKQKEEHAKQTEHQKEENTKHYERVAEEKQKNEENIKYDDEKKRKLAQKIIDDEAIEAAKKQAALAAEHEAKEEAEKEEERKKKAERERKYDIVEMTFRTRGPLGLFFVPEKVPMTLDRDHEPLKRGDEMVSLNGMDLLQYETIDEIMAVLIEATWPKGFQFRRARTDIPGSGGNSNSNNNQNRDGNGGGTHNGNGYNNNNNNNAGGGGSDGVFSSTKITIVSPPILFGMRYDFKVAKFGNRQVTDCQEREVVFSEPYAACKPLKTFGVTDRYREKVVLVQRGICIFPDKSLKVEKSGGAFTVIVNNKNEIIEMPGPKKPLELYKPTVMVTKDTGMFFRQITDILDANSVDGNNKNIVVRMADTPEGCPTLKGEGAAFTMPWTDRKLDGKLHIWNGQAIKSFDVAQGGFGKNWDKEPKRIVIAKPRSACDEKGFSVNVQNSIVIVERGECSFVDKARLIQKVGGIGMVCVNSGPRPRLLMMPAGPDGATDVTISTMMIPFGSFDEIEQFIDSALGTPGKKKALIARAQVKPMPKNGQ